MSNPYVGDIRITLDNGEGSITIEYSDLARDSSLETAMIISLLTDQRASMEQLEEAGLDKADPHGWWGDQFDEKPIGSFLWLMDRAKILPSTPAELKARVDEAWAWLIEDGVAEFVNTTVARVDVEELLVVAEVLRPKGFDDVTFKFYLNWEAQKVRSA